MKTLPDQHLFLLLRIIADELYVARIDRDFAKSNDGAGFELWEGDDGLRAEMIRGIDQMRDEL